jgi:hypothetical protein
MGLLDVFEEAVDAVGDAAEAVGEAVVDVGDAALDAAGSAGGVIGDAVAATANAVDTVTFGAAGAVVNALDDTVFDAVDAATGGLINVDFDDGTFSANVGVDGALEVGASLGKDGVTAVADAYVVGTEVAVTDEGFEYSTKAGIDFGPLPYTETEIDVDPDGDASFHHESRVILPTPYGILTAEGEVDAARNDGAWGVSADGSGTLYTPDGLTVSAAANAGYQEDAEGNSAFTVGGSAAVSKAGFGTAGVGASYERLDVDGVVVEQAHGGAYVEGFGARVDATVDYAAVTTDTDSVSVWDTDVDASGLAQTVVDLAEEVVDEFDDAMADADEIESTTDDLFSGL